MRYERKRSRWGIHGSRGCRQEVRFGDRAASLTRSLFRQAPPLPEEEGWMREARLAAMVQSGRRGGRSGIGSRRHPRRKEEKRTANDDRTTEENEQHQTQQAKTIYFSYYLL